MEKKHEYLFCPECGVKLDGDEFICSVCGFKLAAEQPVAPPPPPPPPVEEIPVTPPPPPAAEPPSVTFCPNCGAKIEGDELFCNSCGFRLADVTSDKKETPPPPVVPPPPPVVETPYIPPVADQPYYQQPQQPFYPSAPPKKKGMGAGWWILIILLIVIVLGGGTVAFLQYNGTINVEFLNDYISPKDSQSTTTNTTDPTRYYIVHSFAVIGTTWTAIISDVVVSRKELNSEEGAKNQFKIAIKNKYPGDYQYFYSNVLSEKYMTYTEAQSAHTSILKSYGRDQKNYTIRTISFGY